MADKIVTYNGKMIAGPSGTGMVIVPGPPTMSIRFKFTSNNLYFPGNFDPSDAKCEKGTWNKVEEVVDEYSIWDWIYTGSNASRAFYGIFTYDRQYDKEIVSINCTSEITNISEMFAGCTELNGLLLAYNYLSNLTVKHDNCFYQAGGNLEQRAEIADIPEDWGGTKPLTGRGIKLGNYIWDKEAIGFIDIPGLVEIDEYSDFEPGTKGYLQYEGVTYYTKAAIDYIKNHPEVLETLYNGWHLPTYEEGADLVDYLGDINRVAFFQTSGINGFNMRFSSWNPGDTSITSGDSLLQYDKDNEEWVYGSIGDSGPLRDPVYWPLQGNNRLELLVYGSYACDLYASDYDLAEPSFMYPVRLVKDHN
jgi:hypothetical protein